VAVFRVLGEAAGERAPVPGPQVLGGGGADAVEVLEGLDEILTVNRPGLPPDLRRSLACGLIRFKPGRGSLLSQVSGLSTARGMKFDDSAAVIFRI
jgi:hypothetical protein